MENNTKIMVNNTKIMVNNTKITENNTKITVNTNIMESNLESTKKYSAIDMFKCAPEFRESRVKVESSALLPQEFFAKCAELFPTAECDEDKELKRKLNEALYEKAQKKHKNFLRRQRAKQAKTAQKERELAEEAEKQQQTNNVEKQAKNNMVHQAKNMVHQAKNTKNMEHQAKHTKTSEKLETVSLAGSDSGVSVKSANSTKTQKTTQKYQKNKTVQKKIKNNNNTPVQYSVFKTPEIGTPESVRQPIFSSGVRSNFQNQGKLRASTDDKSVIGNGSSSTVFVAKPVTEPRTWSNSRLHKRQPRGRIGSRS